MTVMRLLYLFLLLVVLSSCSKGTDVKSLYEEWINKVIVFPKDMTFTIEMRDTVFFHLISHIKY